MKTMDVQTRVQFKNILFLTDFSEASNGAVPYATALAKTNGAKMHVLHVRPYIINPMTRPETWPAEEQAAAMEAAEERRSLELLFAGIHPEITIKEGQLWDVVEREVKDRNIDLIVMGTRGRSGVAKFVLGSAAEEVLRNAHCAVLTIGPGAPLMAEKSGEFQRVLFATNLGKASSNASKIATSIAQEFQAHLTLLHVIEETKANEFVGPNDLLESTKRSLQDMVPPEAESWCAPECIVAVGSPAERILETARERRADLIVLGVHREHGFPGASTHLPFATVHQVVSKAACPVLTLGV
jgi:nucleotide-binding universal stress UspA family protein